MLAEWEAAHGPASPLFVKGLEGAGGGGSAQALKFYEAQLARQLHVALVAGSDRHALFPPGFPTTWVRTESADLAGFLEGIRRRHTFIARSPVAATVEMRVKVGDDSWEMGDAVPIPPAGTMVSVTVRVGRATGGLLRLVSGHGVASDEELAAAKLGHPVLELPLVGDDVETSLTVTVAPGDWLYPVVLEPLIAPGLAPELATMVPGMAANVVSAGVEDYDSLLEVFWEIIDFSVLLSSETNRPTDWCMGALGSAVLFVGAP